MVQGRRRVGKRYGTGRSNRHDEEFQVTPFEEDFMDKSKLIIKKMNVEENNNMEIE